MFGNNMLERMTETESILSRVPERYINLIKRTVAKKATNEELEMFLYTASRYDLDPLMKEIIFFKAGTTPVMVVTRDGYLKVAMRDPQFDGLTAGVVRQGDKFRFNANEFTVDHEFGTKRGDILGAWAIAYHKARRPVVCFVDFKEYRKRNNDVWANYPSAMIQKVAEVFALRRQFNISGLVAREEMGYNMAGTEMITQEDVEMLEQAGKDKELDEVGETVVDGEFSVRGSDEDTGTEAEATEEQDATEKGENKDEPVESTPDEDEKNEKVQKDDSGEEKIPEGATEPRTDASEDAKKTEDGERAEAKKDAEESSDEEELPEITSIDQLKDLMKRKDEKITKDGLTALSRECLRTKLIRDTPTFLAIKREIDKL